MNPTLIHRFAAAALLMACGGASAVDSDPPPASKDKLAGARAQIVARNWSGAIDELKRVNDTGSADWNNLMGYSLRKRDAGNAAQAEKFYDAALRIDPRHRGALEYSGELYLMTGNLPMAEQRLAALDEACRLPCEEQADLRQAIARYKAAGNRYVPK